MNAKRLAPARALVALALGVSAALALSVGAGATATPVSPTGGAAVKTSKPQFSWTLPGTENSVSISVASAPGVTPTGEFAPATILVLDSVEAFERSHTFDRSLPAGKWWWHVASRDAATGQMSFTPATPFTLLPVIRAQPLKVQPTPGGLFVTLNWTMNANRATITSRLYNGTRTVATHSKVAEAFQIESPMSDMYTLLVPKSVRKGTLLRIVATVAVGSTRITVAKAARAG